VGLLDDCPECPAGRCFRRLVCFHLAYPQPSGRDAPALTESRTGGILAGPSVRSRGPPGSGRRLRAGHRAPSRAGWPQAKQAARPCSPPICPAFMPATRSAPTVACWSPACPALPSIPGHSTPTPRHHASVGPVVSVASTQHRSGPFPPVPPSRPGARPADTVPSSSSATPWPVWPHLVPTFWPEVGPGLYAVTVEPLAYAVRLVAPPSSQTLYLYTIASEYLSWKR